MYAFGHLYREEAIAAIQMINLLLLICGMITSGSGIERKSDSWKRNKALGLGVALLIT